MSAHVVIHRPPRFVLATRMGYPNRYAQLYVGMVIDVYSALRKQRFFHAFHALGHALLRLAGRVPLRHDRHKTGSAHHAR